MVAFLLGAAARRMSALSPVARRDVVLQALARLTGSSDALTPSGFIEHDWCGETWSRGGYLSTTGPGVLSAYGAALRRPFGQVHWAGTETAVQWAGYFEGALDAAERAAGEVAVALRPLRAPEARL
jgi:monoamine oxidase